MNLTNIKTRHLIPHIFMNLFVVQFYNMFCTPVLIYHYHVLVMQWYDQYILHKKHHHISSNDSVNRIQFN